MNFRKIFTITLLRKMTHIYVQTNNFKLIRVLPISSKFQRFGCLCSNLSCFSLIKIEIGVFCGIIVCVSPVSFFISSSGAKGAIGCPISKNVNSVTFRVTALSREFVKLQFDSRKEFENCLKNTVHNFPYLRILHDPKIVHEFGSVNK